MKTDAQLQQDVMAELTWEPSVNAAHIGVEVKEGVVTLAGHVDSYAEKWSAERAAQRVQGVQGLAVEMEVKLPAASKRSDGDVARSVEGVLQWMTFFSKDNIKVLVEKGWVTLSGTVHSYAEGSLARHAAWGAPGVRAVVDHMTVAY
jgi:osmotically-inducible protein OsmY